MTFGSAVTGQLADTSHIDLVVEFERPIGFKFLDLAEDLERLLARKVDILTAEGMNSIRVPSVAEDIREDTVPYMSRRFPAASLEDSVEAISR